MQSSSKLHSTSSQPQMASEMQGKHSAASDGMENKQQNQHQSRKMRQDFCEDASLNNRPHKSSPVSENPTPPSSQPDFRLSYEGGNRPTNQQDENCQKCASIQDQHLNEGKILAQSSDCCENGEQSSHCRQSQSVQMKSGLVRDVHSLPVCVHDHLSECRESHMQCERQLRDSNEQLSVAAD
ncbi:MAG: hypothetical protein GY820_42695, partial [Gammaproteobacteria bacterium]|nr:hypothetical protein [Gammaproteobacteria bacterium]